MAKSKHPPEATAAKDRELAESVSRLADEVEVLRNAIDEFREIFTWAVRSDRLRSGTDAPTAVEPPPARVLELNEDQFQAMTEALKESVQDLAGDVEETLRDSLREEVGELRDAMDQLSTDMTWAVRTVRQTSPNSPALCCQPEPTAAEQELADEHPEPTPLTKADIDHLQWLARKSFTASSAIAYIAESKREAPPSDGQRQRPLFE